MNVMLSVSLFGEIHIGKYKSEGLHIPNLLLRGSENILKEGN